MDSDETLVRLSVVVQLRHVGMGPLWVTPDDVATGGAPDAEGDGQMGTDGPDQNFGTLWETELPHEPAADLHGQPVVVDSS